MATEEDVVSLLFICFSIVAWLLLDSSSFLKNCLAVEAKSGNFNEHFAILRNSDRIETYKLADLWRADLRRIFCHYKVFYNLALRNLFELKILWKKSVTAILYIYLFVAWNAMFLVSFFLRNITLNPNKISTVKEILINITFLWILLFLKHIS